MRYLLILFTCSLLISCLKNHDEIVPDLDLEQGKPAGGIVSQTQINNENGLVTFEMTIFAVDVYGNFIENLNQDNFALFNNTPFGIQAGVENLSLIISESKPAFSAAMLFDESISIEDSDPLDARIDAGLAFANKIKSDEEASIAGFAGTFTFLLGFTNNVEALTETILQLKNNQSSTAIFHSVDEYLTYVNNNASSDNKSIIVFTDGGNNVNGITVQDVIEKANTNGVTVHMITLGSGAFNEDAKMLAFQTGGTVMPAVDALQLIALYGSLGDLLNGGNNYYTISLSFERDDRDWIAGDEITGNLDLQFSEEFVVRYPYSFKVE